ncbi:MAG: DNA-3-methyladenine glycosylase [Phormidesmis sp.]
MSETTHISADWFNRSSLSVAEELIGCILVREINGETIRGQIVETEAYQEGDPAMYAYQTKTKHNAVVFGPAGIAYVYRIYRQYHCFNIVTDRDGFPSTILIRAVDLETLPSWVDPKKDKLPRVAAGPGKLCRSLQIDESLKGIPIQPQSGLWVEHRPKAVAEWMKAGVMAITQTTRIGLSKGADIPWRWYLSDSPAVSKKAKA